jgi:hypothetical protein
MTTLQAGIVFKDYHTRKMYDRWIKDPRVKSIENFGTAPAETKLIKVTVARVLADLDVHTGTLAVRSSGRTTECKIEADLLLKAGISPNFFRIFVQRSLRAIRDVSATTSYLSPVNDEGYLTFVYEP